MCGTPSVSERSCAAISAGRAVFGYWLLTDFIEEDGVLPVHDDLSEKGGAEAEGREDKNDGFLHEIRV